MNTNFRYFVGSNKKNFRDFLKKKHCLPFSISVNVLHAKASILLGSSRYFLLSLLLLSSRELLRSFSLLFSLSFFSLSLSFFSTSLSFFSTSFSFVSLTFFSTFVSLVSSCFFSLSPVSLISPSSVVFRFSPLSFSFSSISLESSADFLSSDLLLGGGAGGSFFLNLQTRKKIHI